MIKSNAIALSIGSVVVIAAVALIGWFSISSSPTIIQGQVEATSIKVSSKLAGRIDTLCVSEGQNVRRGELLFVIGTPEVRAKLLQVEALRRAAQAQSDKARNGARSQDIEAAGDMANRAEAAAELARKSYDRVRKLHESGVVPAQKLDEATANMKAAQSAAKAAKAQYNMAIEGARREDRASASALVDQASGAVTEVESYLGDATQYSPIDGQVSSIIAQRDELVGAGYPVVTLLDMNDIWVSFNIKEDLLPKIKMGTTMVAYVPGIGKDIELKVYFMASQGEYATWTATKSKGEFDIRTFEVKARPTAKIEDLRPGMTVAVNWDKL